MTQDLYPGFRHSGGPSRSSPLGPLSGEAASNWSLTSQFRFETAPAIATNRRSGTRQPPDCRPPW